jgi:hypothetical protein
VTLLDVTTRRHERGATKDRVNGLCRGGARHSPSPFKGADAMPMISLHLNGDGAWPDLAKKDTEGNLIHLQGNDGPPIGLCVLDSGMVGGRPSVAIRIDLPDGRTVLAETSLRLLLTAAKAFEAKYPDLLDGPKPPPGAPSKN